MKKEYTSPELELMLVRFEAMMSEMRDSTPEDHAEDGDDNL